MSLRIRLTLVATILPGAALIVFGFVVYFITANNRYSAVDDVLEARAREIQAFARGRPSTVPESALSGETLAGLEADTFADSVTYVQIVTSTGEVVRSSESLQGRSLPLPGPPTVNDDGEFETTARTYRLGRERVRVLDAPMTGREGDILGSILVGRSLTSVDRALSDLRNVMVAGGGLVLAGVAVLGYVFTGRGLRPLRKLETTAREISETGDFSQRIDVGGDPAEVDRLGHTFNDMVETVERTFDAQREFLADSSHELRRPLTIIRGNLDLLANPGLDDEGRAESLDEMRIEAERMSDLISDLLLLARVERREALQSSRFDFAALVRDVVQRRHDPEPRPQVVCEVESPLPIVGDEGRLQQMVSNLVDNAVRYTDAGGRVTVVAERRNGNVALEVQDTGMGIATSDLPHVFDRFFRAPEAVQRTDEGMGLGLAIVKYIAEAHGGRVRAESTAGVGSRFTVELPAASD